jgi:GDP-mannose 4,6-dehydratase|tara:strand:- start:1233 stop:2213 length:981 start_codon:yes stop_codon:yes gene_type:complete
VGLNLAIMINRKFKKCLITGITGSGGSYLAEHILLKDKRIKIFGIYRSVGYKKLLQNKRIELFKVDLCNFYKTQKIINKINPDLIFHLASSANVRESFDFPKKIIENNNTITLNLLEIVRKNKIKPLIIICSTSEVYGKIVKKDAPIKETKNISPVNPYSVSKAFQDLISQVYFKNYGLKIIITRMFSYINARKNYLFQTAFAKQIVDIERGKKKILVHGNLNSIRNIIDIADAMEAYWLTAKRGRLGEIYNISGKKVISVRNYLKELKKLSNIKIKSKIDKKLMRPVDVTLQISDSKKFIRDTRWSPKISFKESMKKLLYECRKS